MQKKKKKWLIIAGIILAVLIVISLLVYFGINMLFSLVSDSFYQSGITITESGGATQTDSVPGAEGSDIGPRGISFESLKLSPEEFKELQQHVSFADKVAALGILSSGLSGAEYTELFNMLGGGITTDEVKKAYQIVSRGLSSEDKEKIWGYYDKYKHLIQ